MIKTRFEEVTELLEGQCSDPLADGNSPLPGDQLQEPLELLPFQGTGTRSSEPFQRPSETEHGKHPASRCYP